jgi:competence protein ComEC
MKLPAVAIAAAFASGIALGLRGVMAGHVRSLFFLGAVFAVAATSLLTVVLFLHYKWLKLAGVASAIAWMVLGVAGACIEQQPQRADHILSLVHAGKINLKTPLRYYGKLRDEPQKLPWGWGYEIALSGVDYEGAHLPATGGLRLSFASRAADETVLPTLHAGDSIAFITQAKLPQVYRDEGAFDRRAYLSEQGVDLVGALRSAELLEVIQHGKTNVSGSISRARRRLRAEIDELLCNDTNAAGLLRAMLLGDRSFVDRDEAVDFQKTGAFHVLVVAGLHVGAIAAVLFWIGRRLRWARTWMVLLTLLLLAAYVGVVEQRTPVLRAGLMAALVLLGSLFFRRLELLNSAAMAALLLLVARPLALRDSSFQLSFLAIGCIAGLALPWLENTVQPYARALHGWRDVTKDVSHEPRPAQFRIDLRSLAQSMESRLPVHISRVPAAAVIAGLGFTFRVWELLVLTMVLQIGMLPVMAGEFHRISFSGPFVNFAALPLTAVIVPTGFFVLITGLVSPALGKLLALPLSWMTLALVHVVQWFSHVRLMSYRVPGPPHWVTVVFMAILAAAAVAFRVNLRRPRLVAATLCTALAALVMVIAIAPFAPRWSAGKLEVSVLDVGQGDSLFVVSPSGKTLLIDGGGAFGGFPGHEQARGSDPGEEAVSPYLWSRGFKKIDVVALTHAHQDHLGGLNAILENFRVGRLWIGREVHNAAFAKLEALARAKNIPIEYETRGKSFGLDGAEGEFLWPETADAKTTVAAKNNDSLVLRLKYGERTLLLPGDAEKQVENTLVAEDSRGELHADVLKVGHHGSKNSTTEEFLRAVQPRIAVISAGEDNPYGHPAPELLERLEASGARILRTDRDGAVRILTDGKGLEISCFVTCVEATAVAASQSSQAPDGNKHEQH